MSTQPPPPLVDQPLSVTQHSGSGHGSVGPTIAVLAVIMILGIVAGMIGRLCSGRTVMGHGHYDFEAWVDRKCSTCLDGSVDVPKPPTRLPGNVAGNNAGDQFPVEIQQHSSRAESGGA